MKLPMKVGEEGGDETAEDESVDRQRFPRTVSPGSESDRLELELSRARVCPPQLDKETVFEWFGLHLNPAKRVEFMCGLLHMCQPLELRFLGSYLEDLARKDYHVLRDFEFRANSPSDLGLLTNVIDPVVRSKLLVCLSLLGSDSRECAGILFRILSHVDPAVFYKNYDYSLPPFPDPHQQPLHPPCQGRPEQTCGLSPNDLATGPLEQLALLFTMASLHPAFHFHQRETVRAQLDRIELALEEERRQSPFGATEMSGPKADYIGECTASHPPCQTRRSSRRTAQREAVHIEAIVLRDTPRTRIDKEYNFEVKWSDSSSSNVTKTHLELENFLLKLPKDQCTEPFAKSILRLLNQGDQYQSREVEINLRERFLSAPPVFKQTRKVCSFFNCDSSHSAAPTCCRCSCQLGKAYQAECSDASSQEEDLESYVQGHKKKHGTKSPCPGLPSAKVSQGDSWRGMHTAELSGVKKSCTQRSSQEAEQEMSGPKADYIGECTASHPPCQTRRSSRRTAQREDRSSGADTFGETSSESYSSPSSPQHRGPESLDSEDDNNKDTDSHSDDSSKGPGPDLYFTQTGPAVVREVFMSLPFVLTNGATDSSLPQVPPPNQNIVTDGKPSPGTLMMQMPLVPPAVPGPGIMGDLEKRDMLPTFGIPPMGLHPPGSPAVQPLVARFKTVMPHSQGGADCGSASSSAATVPPASNQAPVRPISVMTPGPTSFPSNLQQSLPCQDPANVSPGLASSLPHGEKSHVKHAGLTLPSALPSPYPLPPVPTSVMSAVAAPAATGIAPSPGHVQATLPPAVPTHTPGPAPSPTPALTHSTAHSDCTSYSNSSASCGTVPLSPGNSIPLQQTQQKQATPPPTTTTTATDWLWDMWLSQQLRGARQWKQQQYQRCLWLPNAFVLPCPPDGGSYTPDVQRSSTSLPPNKPV
ncbi:hypothetical protein Q5P01_003200 [Channa striata]|uniref:Zinc finger CCHC domain-containing protein 2 n=1 Tax=Channa striata TaxID=64152 RepID=A0AA88NLP8_CHASR|nr:hypothetical protein Q5P01_003200 [Channa striata]